LEIVIGEIQTELEFQLLTDADGIYGVGFRPSQHTEGFQSPAPDVILRSDQITPAPPGLGPVLTFNPVEDIDLLEPSECSGLLESTYVDIQATLIARRKGISSAQCQREAFEEVGAVMRTAYASCVSPSLLPLLRQIPINKRYQAYTHIAGSPRFAQLFAVFPVLGIKMMCSSGSAGLPEETIARAKAMVEEGCKLKKIADVMKVAYAMRKIAIEDADSAIPIMGELCDHNSHLRDYWDRNSENIEEWFWAILLADISGGSEYAAWIAGNYHELSADCKAEQGRRNIGDWVRAGIEGTGIYPVARPFVRTMSVRTVKRLSDEWHQNTEQIYNAVLGINLPTSWREGPEAEEYETEKEYTESIRKKIAAKILPKPWIGDAEINGISIKAAINELELIEASLYLKNCGGSYSNQIRDGECCIYLAWWEGKLLAMVEVRKSVRGHEVSQCAGYLNQSPSTQTLDAVKEWELAFRTSPEPTWEEIYTSENWELEVVPPEFQEGQSHQPS
jgi:hypothetical protein